MQLVTTGANWVVSKYWAAFCGWIGFCFPPGIKFTNDPSVFCSPYKVGFPVTGSGSVTDGVVALTFKGYPLVKRRMLLVLHPPSSAPAAPFQFRPGRS